MEYDSDSEDIDAQNYKGIYFGDESQKWQCPVTGAHFRYKDMFKRLEKVAYLRHSEERERDKLLQKVNRKREKSQDQKINLKKI